MLPNASIPKRLSMIVENGLIAGPNLNEIPNKGRVIMPFKYTDGKENSLYAWRAFSYGKKIEIFC